MKLVKSLLLGTVAGIAATAGAQAADLPSRKAAPVEYVRVCSTFGAGFFYIPGTDTCIRIGGRARFEYQYGEPFARNDSVSGTRTTGRVFLDARTATEYGLVRAYVRYDISRRIGQIRSGSAARVGTAFEGSSVDYAGVSQTQVDLNRAFVQFGGLTAGRSQSYFDFYAGDLEYVGTTAGSSLTTNLLAYTATFGSGFSATLSLEDSVERRTGVLTQNLVGAPGIGTYRYTGEKMPDIVANLRVDQGWGSVQLSGALHQISVGNFPGGLVGTNGNAPDSEYGYAINLGTKINLPMLAAGDVLYLQGTYTKGAPNYILSNPFGLASTTGGGGAIQTQIPDAFLIANASSGGIVTNFEVEKPAVWGLTAAMLHYWTPTIRQAFLASYIKADVPGSAAAAGALLGGTLLTRARDLDYWTLGTNVTWSPIKDLDIGAEVNYLHYKGGQGASLTAISTDPVLFRRSDSIWNTRLKIQRDF